MTDGFKLKYLDANTVYLGPVDRRSELYRVMVCAIPVSEDDVTSGRVIELCANPPQGAYVESFAAELGPTGPRWAGPLASAGEPDRAEALMALMGIDAQADRSPVVPGEEDELAGLLIDRIPPRVREQIRDAGIVTVEQARERFALHKKSVSAGGPLRARHVRYVRRAIGLLDWPEAPAPLPPNPKRAKAPEVTVDPAEVGRHVQAEEYTVVHVRWTCLDDGHNHGTEDAARQCVEKRLRVRAREAARSENRRDHSPETAERYASLHEELGTYAAVARAEGVPYDYALEMVKKGYRIRRIASRTPDD